MQEAPEPSANSASFLAGIAGAVMMMLICFAIALTLNMTAGAKTGSFAQPVAQAAANN